MADAFIYLKFKDGALLYSDTEDSPSEFKKVQEVSGTGCSIGSKVHWKISSDPGELTAIKIKDEKKKDGYKLPRGSWKDLWTTKPTKVSSSEYWGEPNGEGATEENQFVFAYSIDYKIDGQNGWITIDPNLWQPPAPPPPPPDDK